MSAGRILWGQIGLVFGLILTGVWGATQWTAWRLAYQPALGAPWFEVAGHPVYAPPSLFLWWFSYEAYAPRIFLEGGAIAAGSGLAAIAASIALAVWRSREAASATTYGTARWGDVRDAKAAGLLGEDGVLLGELKGRYLRHDGPEHVLCFAPTRTYSHGDPVARFDAPFLAAAIRHFGRIHGRPLKRLIEQSPSVPLRPDDAGSAMAQARLFDRWMPWLPGQGQCVYRAYLLRACLAAQGLGSTWIFGVRTWPFSAHCWLQIGDVLLDDDLDRVGLYTPILAVGP